MRVLDMPLCKEYYEMIARGEKPEEYREKKAYWIVRLYEWREGTRISMAAARVIESEGIDVFSRYIVPKHYDAVRFSYGYTKRRMLWEYRGLDFGQGCPEWGGPDHEVFIIKLGKKL
ncbi:hypothetical protein [uncultured Alistipes sp.]|uniref:hypothetical protein n=1 Tax=uncultured Alistipes sp. TaxID=538949 RepID=UPI00272D775F|nr:hypothetical protein [uncultured Alistipes sp.]